MTPAQFVSAVAATMQRRAMNDDFSDPILVAVSGGADSLALLYALHRLGHAIEVAHFDHRARSGSAADAAFVQAQATKLGVGFHIGAPNADEQRSGRSSEDHLRTLRLAFLERTATALKAGRIATGHTRDDQAETVMMRTITGGGRRGLSGIPPVRGPFIRPLIDLGRVEVLAFCASLKLRPRSDPSNADQSYLRNAIRADLLPHIAGRYNQKIDALLARTADILRDEDDLLEKLAAAAITPEASAGTVRIDAGALAKLHPALQRRALRRVAPLPAEQTEKVRLLALEGKTGDQIDLPQGLNARCEYGWLVIGPVPSSPARPETCMIEVPGETFIPQRSARLRATITTRRPSPIPDGVSACALDAAKVHGPLVVRAPKPGDRFRPLGMRGAKKLGDYFTDVKVPRAGRSGTPVVAGRDGIVWLVGHRIDEGVKVTPGTKRILILEWEG